MIQDDEIDRLSQVEDRHQAADGLGLLLYGRKGSRFIAFRAGFLEGLEEYGTSHWREARGVGPRALGNNLAAAWSERRR